MMRSAKVLRIALVGNPNCGKTALFNALTGSKQRVANYPGVTIEKKHGYLTTPNNIKCTIVDLPGTYSLHSRSLDEQITRDVVMNQYANEQAIDIILCVVDATNLTSGIRLILELKQTNKPIIVALNMADIAKRKGYTYDIAKLKEELGCTVVATTAIKKQGIIELVTAVDQVHQVHLAITPTTASTITSTWTAPTNDDVRNYHIKASQIINRVKLTDGTPSLWSEWIDRILLHPVYGVVILLAVLFFLFQAVFSIATIPQGLMQDGVDWLQKYVTTSLLPHSLIGSLIGNGIIAGVGAVVVFLPQILTISLFIIILEDSGYMARAAFLMDKIMGSAGLNGRAFIPLLSSFACAIPGIMASRTIENRNDRLITILISPLITCSARLPIYTLLISAFIPAKTVLIWFNLQGLIMFLLYFVGIGFALLMALIFKLFIFKSQKQISLIELPSYKLPNIRNVAMELLKPASSFLRRAGTIIIAVMVILWGLSTFPLAPKEHILPAIDYSFVGILGHMLAPIFAPIGFSWQIVAALIPGVAAREVAVSALGTIYAMSNPDEEVLRQGLATLLHHSWSLATALSLITWYVFAPQCISTLAVAKRETNSWRWPVIMFTYQIALAYIMAFVVYRLTILLM
jgi:ferrous iron transport protein B